MDKAEILKRLNESGLIHRFRNEKLWRLAFEAYNAEQGTNLKPNCGKCFTKVKEWLNR